MIDQPRTEVMHELNSSQTELPTTTTAARSVTSGMETELKERQTSMGGGRTFKFLSAFRERTGFGKKLLNPNYGIGILNVAATIGLFVFFVYNAVIITRAYKESLESPPTTLTVTSMASTLLFPSILICNLGNNSPLTLLYASFYFANDTEIDIEEDVFPAKDRTSCFWVNGARQPAFSDNGGGVLDSNTLSMAFDINLDSYTSNDPLFGVDMALVYDFEQRFGPYDSTPLTSEMIEGYATTGPGQGTLASLTMTKYELYDSDRAKTEVFYDLDVNTGLNPINPSSAKVESINASSTVLIQLSYYNGMIRIVSSAPQSFSTFFGSLAGWMGACSDGWGVLSVLFFLEKFFLRAAGKTKEQLWFVPANQELERRVFG